MCQGLFCLQRLHGHKEVRESSLPLRHCVSFTADRVLFVAAVVEIDQCSPHPVIFSRLADKLIHSICIHFPLKTQFLQFLFPENTEQVYFSEELMK